MALCFVIETDHNGMYIFLTAFLILRALLNDFR